MAEPELAALLGQDAIAAELLENLVEDEAQLVRLTGVAGSGKSHIAKWVAKAWKEEHGSCLVAVGDEGHSWREVFPLLVGLAQTHRDWVGLATTGTRSALRVADTAAKTGGIGTSIFDLLTAGFRQQVERALRGYSDRERDVILDLKRLGRRRRLLLIADNAHWLDADSLWLLADVLSERLREAIPQLCSVQILLVDTEEEQAVAAPEAFSSLMARCSERTFRSRRCSREHFPMVLKAFGVTDPLPDKVIDELFAATHGHLKLAEQVGAYETSVGSEAPIASRDRDYAADLVAARLDSLGSFSPEVMELLVRAAVLGLSCGERDLQCIAERDSTDVRELVGRAEDIGFVEYSESQIAFSHDVIRSTLIKEQPPARLEDLHLKLSRCLAILRPGDYEERARALLRAGELEQAREMVALAAVAQLRRGVSLSKVLRRAEQQFPGDEDLAGYLQVMGDGYATAAAGQHASMPPRLRTPQAGETTAMAAERNYLVSMYLLSLPTIGAAAEAGAILNAWAPEADGEIELGLRFLILLQQAQVLSERFDKALQTEADIERRLTKRRNYDPEAKVLIHVQNRRAGGPMAPEFARDRIDEAVAFFRQGSGDPRRDRLELFRSITNQAAIEVRLDLNAEAYAHALEAEQIALESLEVGERLDVLAHNMVLSGYRSGKIDIEETVARQTVLMRSPEGSEDNFAERCNLVAYLLLAERDEQAAAALKALEEEVQVNAIDETYLVYYCNALAVAVAALGGDLDEAMRRHRQMAPFVESLKWPTAPYVRRRQQLLDEALPDLDLSRSRDALDRVIIDSHPLQIGEAWPYYGRLFPCCELSFWVES